MRLRPTFKWVNGPYILWLIREGKVKTRDDIYDVLSNKLPQEDLYYGLHRVIGVLNELENAGLVEHKDEEFTVTPLVSKIQGALNLSLKDLSDVGPDTTMVQPFWGRPQRPEFLADVFVLMPFSDELKPVYEDHIKLIASRLDLKTARADDFFAANSIVTDIWNAIYSSQIIIADCTGRNPNVFYEIGIAHTVGKPTILISQNINDIPFDLQHIRYIVYQYTPRGMATFNEALYKALEVGKAKITDQDT